MNFLVATSEFGMTKIHTETIYMTYYYCIVVWERQNQLFQGVSIALKKFVKTP